jgi:hypothetical protein
MKAIWGGLLVVCLGIAGIGVINLTNTAEAELAIDVSTETATADQIIIDGAVKILATECPRFKNAWPDFVGANAAVQESWLAENMSANETRGWSRIVELNVEVAASNTVYMPQDAAGHTLQFLMGGGHQPGIFVVKNQAAWLCMMPEGDSFKDVGALAFIK